jgi:teichuronic acid exporter
MISFGVSIVLARLILPEEFGLIGMIAIFMGHGTALFQGCLASSLIRTKELKEDDYSTVFFFNLAEVLLFMAFCFWQHPG